MELIEEQRKEILLNRWMDEDDTMLFTFRCQMPNGANIYAQIKV